MGKRPLAYTTISLTDTPMDTKIVQSQDVLSAPVPVLISSLISSLSIPVVTTTNSTIIHLCTSTPKNIPNIYLHSVPVLLTTAPHGCANTCLYGDGT